MAQEKIRGPVTIVNVQTASNVCYRKEVWRLLFTSEVLESSLYNDAAHACSYSLSFTSSSHGDRPDILGTAPRILHFMYNGTSLDHLVVVGKRT